jgi:hypothetical protein
MGIRMFAQRHWIGLGFLAASLIGAVPGAVQAQLPIESSTPQCLARTLLKGDTQAVGTFQPTCGLMWAEHAINPIVIGLQDGTVLVAGGFGPQIQNAPPGDYETTDTGEIYHPREGIFLPAGSMPTQGTVAQYVLLGNGQVLIAYGGEDPAFPDVSEVYVPDLLSFRQVGSFVTDRYYGSFGLAPFGKTTALLAGGLSVGSANTVLAAAEVYNAESHGYAATGSLNQARSNPGAVELADGSVLVMGGFAGTMGKGVPASPTTSAETYNPTTGKFSLTGSLTTVRAEPYSVLLGDGRVLVVGGETSWDSSPTELTTAEIYDPASGRFSSTGSLLRSLPSCMYVQPFLMKNGKVLIGDEIYDPAMASFSLAPGTANLCPPEPDSDYGTTQALLETGQVLWVGDGSLAFLYQPPP